jgi:histidinol dehydrogenase
VLKSISIPIIDLTSPSGKRRLESIKKVRSTGNAEALRTVEKIISDVRKKGDMALFAYTKKFDGVALNDRSVTVEAKEIKALAGKAPLGFKKALKEAAKRIYAYHSQQKSVAFSMTTSEGMLSQKIQPLSRVGVYVPGGHTLYPSSVLMNIIPAQIAGVKEIVVVTPPRGGLDPKIAFALDMLKIRTVYKVGGAQAIAALAYGTRSIPAVDKIVGPGNLYVALAKKMVYGTVDIDMVAGPSEVVILADSTIQPEWIALDLLAQAEHGSGSESALCVVEDLALAQRIQQCLMKEIASSPARAIFERMKPDGICIIVAKDRAQSIDLINDCAPEHLQLMTKTYKRDVERIHNASAIFCGPYSPVALGDYYIGTNHVLPTGRCARYASPLGVESFIKRMSIAEITAHGLEKCAADVSLLARAENFIHHALTVERRVRSTRRYRYHGKRKEKRSL